MTTYYASDNTCGTAPVYIKVDVSRSGLCVHTNLMEALTTGTWNYVSAIDYDSRIYQPQRPPKNWRWYDVFREQIEPLQGFPQVLAVPMHIVRKVFSIGQRRQLKRRAYVQKLRKV